MTREIDIKDFEVAVFDYQRQKYNFTKNDESNLNHRLALISSHLHLLSNGRRRKFVYVTVHKSMKIDLQKLMPEFIEMLEKEKALPDLIEVYSPYIQYKRDIKGIEEEYADVEIKVLEYNALINETIFSQVLEPTENTEFTEIKTIDKTLYDIVSSSPTSTSIKRVVLSAYVLQTLFENDLPKDQLIQVVSDVTKCSDIYLEKLVSKLEEKHKIHPCENGKYQLSSEERKKLQEIINSKTSEEREMKQQLVELFAKYSISGDEGLKLVEKLLNLYKRPYDLLTNPDNKKTDDNIHELAIKELKQEIVNLVTKSNADKLYNEIRDICQENHFLNRVATSHTYLDLYQKEEFQRYISSNYKRIYLDTSLLEYIFCNYTGSVPVNQEDWDDYYYDYTIKLLETQRKNKRRICLCTTEGYLDEVCGELQKALSCALFDEFEDGLFKIGKNTRNVFYNYFQFLKEKEYIDKSTKFAKFIYELGLPNNALLPDFRQRAKAKLRNEFENNLNITIEKTNITNFEWWDSATKHYDGIILDGPSTKTKIAEETDIKLVLHLLSNQDVRDSKTVNYFSSWDRTISSLRDIMHIEYPNTFQFFAVYNPNTLLSVLSLENIRVTPKWLNDITFTYADNTEGVSQKMKSLVDKIVLQLFNVESNSIQFFNKLFDIQKEVFGDNIMKDDNASKSDKRAPIEQVLDDMRKTVQEISQGKDNFKEYLNDSINKDFITSLYKKCIDALSSRKYTIEMLAPLRGHYQQYWHDKNTQLADQIVL